MSLTKRMRQVYHPPIPGRVAVPAQTHCPPPPPGGGGGGGGTGYWQTVCEPMCIPVGIDYGPATPGNPGPFPRDIVVCGQPVCRTVWVRTS